MKGVYVLIVKTNKTISVNIGALGSFTFLKGLYAYVGSAQNNLELRIKRHRSKDKPMFWHIDYLLNNKTANVIGVYFMRGDKTKECKIARLLKANAEPIAGFGCSDCHCESHLFHAENFGFLGKCMQQLTLHSLNSER